jgi:hypothetical protein
MAESSRQPQVHIPAETPPIRGESTTPVAVNPLSLSIDETARMLSAAGGKRITPAQIQADIDAGAPVASGGRINLVHYVAWLIKEVQSR